MILERPTEQQKRQIRHNPNFGTLCSVCQKCGTIADENVQETLLDVAWHVWGQRAYTLDEFESAYKLFKREQKTMTELQIWGISGFVKNISRWLRRKPSQQIGQSPQPPRNYYEKRRKLPENYMEIERRVVQKIPALGKILAKARKIDDSRE